MSNREIQRQMLKSVEKALGFCHGTVFRGLLAATKDCLSVDASL